MVIIETRIFTRRIKELMGDDEYKNLQEALVNRPIWARSSKVRAV